jgi:two-component system alkaline phosphatase synthesis response regulator PhoP
MTSVLVIEDERNLALGLRANLEYEGYSVVVAESGEAALNVVRASPPDLVILDLMLPGMDGYQVLGTLREMGMSVPVLILSARAEEIDKVRGFRAGADDYVTKPFGVLELVLRVQALLRRSAPLPQDGPRTRWSFGDVQVDVARRGVVRGGEDVMLTPRAFELLVALLQREGAPVSRHELLRTVWGYDASVTTRTVDAHIAELRRKLEQHPAEPRYILTVHKVGYRLKA